MAYQLLIKRDHLTASRDQFSVCQDCTKPHEIVGPATDKFIRAF